MSVTERLLPSLAFIAGLLAAGAAEAGDAYRWVQYGPAGLEARAITEAPACPAFDVDGQPVAMTERSAPGENYPIRVCAAPIPAGARLARLEGVPLPLPAAHPNRILVIGDTGCRMKGAIVQACNDAALWPFRVGSDVAALFKPDVVLHVGDFHYRETPCPAGTLGCAGSPSGDNWAVWKADFFGPAQLLLETSPWIFVRGNHEECDRGGKGWARTLDPYPFDETAGVKGCLGPAEPFLVDLNGLKIAVMDVSTASEEKANAAQAARFRAQFQAIGQMEPTVPVWATFHRPIWAVNGTSPANPTGDNKTLALAALGFIPPNVQAFVSGHQHTFQVMSYQEDLPVQIVSGHGGDALDFWSPSNPAGLVVNGITIKAGWGKPRTFGFSLIERAAEDASGTWVITDYDVKGQPLGKCTMVGRGVTCEHTGE